MMLKKIGVGIAVLVLAVFGFVWFKFLWPVYQGSDQLGSKTAPRDLALQDDSRLTLPTPQAAIYQPAPNPELNLYWGELHLHTTESFDSSLFGNTLTIEDAYRFARGEPLHNAGGELMQLTRPLDFVAITDHAEGFGNRTHCNEPGLSLGERAACKLMNIGNPAVFSIMVDRQRGTAPPGDPSKPAGVYQQKLRQQPSQGAFPTCKWGDATLERCYDNAHKDWARYVELADKFYEPGTLTTLVGYEFSPTLPDKGKHHRNVIFRSNVVPKRALSSMDVPNAIELWKGLEADCGKGCDFLTIPHNMNKAWGLTYSRYTWDGQAYDEEGWRLRRKREPLAEIYQIKGAQECALGVGATDEECAFSQVLDPCLPGQLSGCAFHTGFVRQGLKVGLELEQELGFNPMQAGFIAATDSHNSNPGDVEEWDYVGSAGSVNSPAFRRINLDVNSDKAYLSRIKFPTSGGLAAVWAPENTREAIFDALARRESYATSGPRMTLRFYAGWDIEEGTANENHAIPQLMASSVPMGGVLNSDTTIDVSPGFFVWATRDPIDAPLQRVQMVKGWIDVEGKTHERVVDIACSDGLTPNPESGRCPDNGASVDLDTCNFSQGSGADELKTVWYDPQYDPDQGAFYYVRVLMNPTCRWSSYDAIRLGEKPDPRVPATIQERAWSSPIWHRAID